MSCDWSILGSVHLPAGYYEDMNMLDNSDHNENTLFISVSKDQVITLVEELMMTSVFECQQNLCTICCLGLSIYLQAMKKT